MPKEKSPLIYKALADIAQQIEAVSKEKKHQQGFAYRSIDDIYNMVSPLMGKNRVISVPTMLERKNEPYETRGKDLWNHVTIKMQYRFMAEDGSFVDVILENEGSDSGDKATNKALSMAHKYALIQLFHIPTLELDEEAEAVDPAADPAVNPTLNQAPGATVLPKLSAPPVGQKLAEKTLETAKKATDPPPPLTPEAAAIAMLRVAPPPFHSKKVAPAVAPATAPTVPDLAKPFGETVEICECDHLGTGHPIDKCTVEGCDCPAFCLKEYREVAATSEPPVPVNPEPKTKAEKRTHFILLMENCKSLDDLGKVFHSIPKELQDEEMKQRYGVYFLDLKKKSKQVAKV